ncbi:unnamed protein product [Peniophora sp. CBMAI 1063]|nr:unnamed protein product [Peniophora sp. CBMAI 1063]
MSEPEPEPSVVEILTALKKRDVLKVMIEILLVAMSESGRVAVLVSRGMWIARTLAGAADKDASDIARDLFIIEYERLEETKPEIPSFTEIKADYIAFANYCIVTMPPDPTIKQQRAVWSDGLKKWEKSVKTWASLWTFWGEPCHNIFEFGPEEEEGQSKNKTKSKGQALIESAKRIAAGTETFRLRKGLRTDIDSMIEAMSKASFATTDPPAATPSGGVHNPAPSHPTSHDSDTLQPPQAKSSKKKGKGKAKKKGKGKAKEPDGSSQPQP